MQLLKQFGIHLGWTGIALLLGLCHVYVALGPRITTSNSFFTWLLNLLYNHALLYVGLPIGLLLAILFILFDVFFLKKKLNNNFKGVVVRFLVLLTFSVGFGGIHYFLEKVIDVI